MIKINLSALLEQEAKACAESASRNPSPLSDAFTALDISYRSLARRLRAEATPYKEKYASHDSP